MSIKIDKSLKAAAQEVAEAAGIPLSTLIHSYLRQLVATRHIDLYAPEPMTSHLEKLLAESEHEIADGEVFGPFDSVEEMFKHLKKAASETNQPDAR